MKKMKVVKIKNKKEKKNSRFASSVLVISWAIIHPKEATDLARKGPKFP
jgi:hypothetical protein